MILVVGVTYFGMLVAQRVRYSEVPQEQRFTAYGRAGPVPERRPDDPSTSGPGTGTGACMARWPRSCSRSSSILFGVHKLARITIPTAGLLYAFLNVWGDEFRTVLQTLGPRPLTSDCHHIPPPQVRRGSTSWARRLRLRVAATQATGERNMPGFVRDDAALAIAEAATVKGDAR